MNKITKLNFFLIITLISIFFIKCDKNQSNIPNVYVNFTIYLDSPEHIDLAVVGNLVFINRGVNGIVIYRSGIDEFHAYDRTCTYNPDDNCAVTNDENSSVLVKCLCCGSKFSLSYGDVTEGPATIPLKEYNTNFNGTSLHVYN